MPTPDNQPKSSAASPDSAEPSAHGLSWYMGWLLLVLLVYVLSVGPFVKFFRPNGSNPGVDRVYVALYFPLGWLYNHSLHFERVANWYIWDVWKCDP